MDGSSNVKGSKPGIILLTPTREMVQLGIKYHSINNNEDEYEAVVAGLE